MKRIHTMILGSIILPSLLLTACTDNHAQQTANSKTSASIAKKTAKEVASTKTSTTTKSTQNTDSNSSSQSSAGQSKTSNSDDQRQMVQEYLLGKSFTIFPTQYDGEDVSKAMAEQKAPQNTIHDGGTYLYFEDASRVHETGSMMSDNAWYENYTITDDAVQIGSQFKVPYVVSNGTVNFQDWTTNANGHTLTWRLNLDNSAKSIITSKKNQNWHSTN